MGEASILKKITLKTVYGKIDFDRLLNAKDKRMELMKVYGTTGKMRPGSTDLGEFVKFSGRFGAINLETGEQFESGALILPGIAQDMLAGALDSEEAISVDFAFLISVEYDKDAATKYVYRVKSLLEPAKDDPLARLAAAAGVAALPAPEDGVEAEDKVEPPEAAKGAKTAKGAKGASS